MKIDMDMDMYLDRSIKLIGISLLIFAVEFHFSGRLLWMTVIILLFIIFYVFLPSIKKEKREK